MDKLKFMVAVVTLVSTHVFVYGYSYEDYTWHTYDGHEYAITLEWSNWADAEAWAVKVGGHLATINDEAENLWLGDFIKDAYVDYGVAWIGLEYKGELITDSSSWEWQNGECVIFWNSDNIHGLYSGNHMYLHGSNHPEDREYLWNNNPVSDPLPGIIEVPEPPCGGAGYDFVTKWGSLGNGDGQLNSPFGISIDSSGHVYIADGANHRIQVFEHNETTNGYDYLSQWGSPGS